MFQWNFGEFEIERSKIEQGETLGQGSFGMVYRGLYHSLDGDVPCAIKEAKDEEWREQLLGEAYRMRYNHSGYLLIDANDVPFSTLQKHRHSACSEADRSGLRAVPTMGNPRTHG